VIKTEDPMGRAERGGRGQGKSAPWTAPRIGRKDLQDPDRDVMEPGHPVPEDEPGGSDRDAGAEEPVQLEFPATGQHGARE
jgi:hypothetical protein